MPSRKLLYQRLYGFHGVFVSPCCDNQHDCFKFPRVYRHNTVFTFLKDLFNEMVSYGCVVFCLKVDILHVLFHEDPLFFMCVKEPVRSSTYNRIFKIISRNHLNTQLSCPLCTMHAFILQSGGIDCFIDIFPFVCI